MAIGNGVDVYAGHANAPLSMSGASHVDFVILAVQLALIIAAALVGWRMGVPIHGNRGSAAGGK